MKKIFLALALLLFASESFGYTFGESVPDNRLRMGEYRNKQKKIEKDLKRISDLIATIPQGKLEQPVKNLVNVEMPQIFSETKTLINDLRSEVSHFHYQVFQRQKNERENKK